MENSGTIQDYLNKILKVIRYDSVFNFGEYKLVKKSKIDDLLCCIYATLPDSYKHALKTLERDKRLQSLSLYDALTNNIRRKFIFNSQLYLIYAPEIINLVTALKINIDRDINVVENS